MTIDLDLPPEVISRLTEQAKQSGLSLDRYIAQALLRDSPTGANGKDENNDQQSREAAGRSIRQLRRGNVLGPELTVRDIIEEGRRF